MTPARRDILKLAVAGLMLFGVGAALVLAFVFTAP